MTEDEKKWRRDKRNHISKMMYAIRQRAKEDGVEFNLDHKFLCAIAPDLCPIFKIPLFWGYGKGAVNGHASPDSPSLDRIIPERGYTKGNVAWMSHKANTIKNNADENELRLIADWLQTKRKEVLNGGARPPAFDDPANTYLILPAHTRIVAARDKTPGGSN